jgi:hypothetical protein
MLLLWVYQYLIVYCRHLFGARKIYLSLMWNHSFLNLLERTEALILVRDKRGKSLALPSEIGCLSNYRGAIIGTNHNRRRH